MYKLIIADDEKIIRDGLGTLVNWNELGFELVGVFSDGQQVMEYLDYIPVDIIFTDIKMSNISGLDIARYVRENDFDCEVLLLSGHQEFELALQGIKYGAFDYLLKPTNVDIVKDSFAKIKERLDHKIIQNSFKQRLEQTLPLLKERFFVDLILGVIDRPEYVKRRMEILFPNMDLENSFCFLTDIKMNDYDNFMEHQWNYNYDQFEINLANFLSLYQGEFSYHLIYKSHNMLEIFAIRSNDACFDIDSLINELDTFLHEISTAFGFSATYNIKRTFDTIYHVLGYCEIVSDNSADNDSVFAHLIEQKKLIVSYVTGGNIVVAQRVFGNLLDSLNQTAVAYRNNFCIDVFSAITETIKSINMELFLQMQGYINYSKILTLTGTTEAKAYFDKIFDRIRLSNFKGQGNNTDSLVFKIRQYVNAHITEDISQEKTANELYISSSYLSRIFKSITGENFAQYVVKMKMEKAIEMLADNSLKIYNISNLLGYKMPRYFSKLFKAHTGMNPAEYRLKVLNMRSDIDEDF